MKNSIRGRLLVSFLGVAIGPFLLLSVFLIWRSFNIQTEQMLVIHQNIAQHAALQTEQFIFELEGELSLVVDVLNLESQTLDEQYTTLSRLQSYQHAFQELTLLDADGQQQVRISRLETFEVDEIGQHSQSEEFQIPITTGSVYYGTVHLHEMTGEPFMSIGIPLIDVRSGMPNGVVIAELRLKDIWNVIAQIPVGEAGIAYIVNADGNVVAHPNPSVVLRGTNFDVPQEDGVQNGLNGERVVLARRVLEVGNQELMIVVETPLIEALAPTILALLVTVLALITTIIIAVGLGFTIIRQITLPIASLADTAQLIADGDLSQRVELISKDEFGILATAFNVMVEKLGGFIENEKLLLHQMEEIHGELQAIVGASTDSMTIIDADGRCLRSLPTVNQNPYIPTEELVGKTFHELLSEDRAEEFMRYVKHVLDSRQSQQIEFSLPFEDSHIWRNAAISPLTEDTTLWVIRDITQRKQDEESLQEQSNMLHRAEFLARMGHYALDTDGSNTVLSDGLKSIWGIDINDNPSFEELVAMIHPADRESTMAEFEKSALENRGFKLEFRVIRPDKSEVTVASLGEITPKPADGLPRFFGTLLDITERKQDEEAIKAALAEKETLLKEIHHRVKNNLQVISSLLHMQSMKLQDPDMIHLFRESEARVHSMALIHEQLYQTDDLSQIDFKKYIERLVGQVTQLQPTNRDITLDMEQIDPISLTIETAVPCGLIINEVVSNAFKHAFPNDNGTIQIKLQVEDDHNVLVVQDNGVGLPVDFDKSATKTLGIRLLTMLVMQIEGALDMTTTEGTTVTVRFPRKTKEM